MCKKIGSLVLIFAVVLVSTLTFTTNVQAASIGTNLALNQWYWASSDAGPSYDVYKAFDGNSTTRWAAATGVTSNIAIQLDFKQATTFDTVVLKEYGNNITSYKIQEWNGTSWDDLYTQDEVGPYRVCTFNKVTAGNMRVLILSAKAAPSLYEFEVYCRPSITRTQQFRTFAYIHPGSFNNPLDSASFDNVTDVIMIGYTSWNSTGHIYTIDPNFDNNLATLRTAIGSRNVKIWNVCGNNNGLGSTNDTIFGNSTYRQNFVNDALNMLNTYNLDGLDIDWEYPNSSTGWSNFSQLCVDIKNGFRPYNKMLSLALAPWGVQLSSQAISSIDYINSMIYDLLDANHYHATFTTYYNALSYFDGVGIPRNKLNMGIPYYSRLIDPTQGTETYDDYNVLMANYPGQIDANTNILGNYYFNGLTMTRDKTMLAIMNDVSGIMIWHLFADVPVTNSLSLLNADADIINQTINYTFSTVNDNTTGNGNNKFEYVGTWNYNTYGVSANYNGDEHWSGTTDVTANFRFYGTQVKLYGIKDSNEGIAGISIDNGAETNVDFYSSTRQYQILVYTSPTLTAGQHTVTIRLTGTKNASATDTVLSLDKMEVYP